MTQIQRRCTQIFSICVNPEGLDEVNPKNLRYLRAKKIIIWKNISIKN